MNRNISLTILLSVALVLFAAALYMYRPQPDKLTRVSVAGDARAKIAPDTAVVTFSVVTQNAQALIAQQDNARKSDAVKSAVEAVKAASKIDVKTSGYNLSPEQDYYSGKLPKILGYTVRNTVTARVSDLTQVGAVVDAATKAGANSIESIVFVVGEDSPAHGESLAAATRQALAKAEAIAASLNGRIVRVVESHEAGVEPARAPSDYSSGAMSNAAMNEAKPMRTTPVEAGSLDVRAQVVLTVEIEVRH